MNNYSDFELDIIKRAQAIVKTDEPVYDLTWSAMDGDTATIAFSETMNSDDYADDYTEAEQENATLFYKTIEFWNDTNEFSNPYWMNCYGDIIEI